MVFLFKRLPMFHISRKTISGRIDSYNLREEIPKYDDISYEALDCVFSTVLHDFFNCGMRTMKGFLLGRGVRLRWSRVRSSLWRTDPAGILLRPTQLSIVNQHHYNIPGPRSVWHLDGNHKLIRWGFVIHACVGRFSRTIMFLKCSTNNQVATVLQLFLNAVREFGIPCRVRGDQGTKKIQLARYMISHPTRGPGRGSFIVGKSCHNQRIESFWRDLFHGCTFLFYYIFCYLEDKGLLDVSSFSGLCIYSKNQPAFWNVCKRLWQSFTFLRIKHDLCTTLVLWPHCYCGESELSEVNIASFGLDDDCPLPCSDYDGETWNDLSVQVPEIPCPLSDTAFNVLKTSLDPLEDSSCYGMDIYIESVEVVDDISSRCWLFVGNIGLLTPTQPYTFFIEFVVSLYIAVIFTCCKMYPAYAICTRKCRKILLMYNLFFTNVCGSLLCSFFLPVSSTNHGNCSVTYMLKFAYSSKSTELC